MARKVMAISNLFLKHITCGARLGALTALLAKDSLQCTHNNQVYNTSEPLRSAVADDFLLDAIREQESIGRHNLLLGRLTITWEEYQYDYYLSTSSRRTASSWITQVTFHLLQISRAMWMARNSILDAVDSAGRSIAEIRVLQEQIDSHFATGSATLRPHDKYLLEMYHETVSTLPLPDRKAWILHMDHARAMFIPLAS
jgi:hypothetical protein